MRSDRKVTKRRHKERNILDAAEKVFAREGYNGASIEMIAQTANSRKANVLYYFGSKRQLYRRVLFDICLVWEGPADRFDEDSDPGEALKGLIEAKIDLARERPYGSKVWASEILRGAPIIQDFLRQHLADWLDSRSAVINHWIEQGKLKPIEPRTLFYSIWATTQHYADFVDQIRILNGDRPVTDSQYRSIKRDLTQLYLRGLGLIE